MAVLSDRRVRWGIAAAAVAVLAAVAGFLSYRARNQPVRVTIATAAYGEVTATISATGTVEPVLSSPVWSTVPGKIVKLPVAEGDRVRVGQVLAELDMSSLATQVRQARAGLLAARANLQSIEAQWIRTQ